MPGTLKQTKLVNFEFRDSDGLNVEVRFCYEDGQPTCISVFIDDANDVAWVERNDGRFKPCVSHCKQLYGRLPGKAFTVTKRAMAAYAKRKRRSKSKPQRPVNSSLLGQGVRLFTG